MCENKKFLDPDVVMIHVLLLNLLLLSPSTILQWQPNTATAPTLFVISFNWSVATPSSTGLQQQSKHDRTYRPTVVPFPSSDTRNSNFQHSFHNRQICRLKKKEKITNPNTTTNPRTDLHKKKN
jgi:hypothetical protein